LKKREVKQYKEISGVISSGNVSCDFCVEWLQSITGIAETAASGAGEGRARRTGIAWTG
jgi:hypothetical protein